MNNEQETAPASAPELTPEQRLTACAASLGLKLESAFVPFSASRNATPDSTFSRDGKPWQSLNWRVTLKRNGRDVLTTDYSQGIGHCPAGKAGAFGGNRYVQARAVAIEIETGKRATGSAYQEPRAGNVTIPGPSIADVLHSLTMDSSVLDHASFESWAADFGIDPDSRSGESTYRACLALALALRAGIGEAGIDALREAGADY